MQFTSLQRLAYLLRNLPASQRELAVRILAGDNSLRIDPAAYEVMRACSRVLDTVATAEERRRLLHHAEQTAALLEHQRAEDAKRISRVEVVVNVPRYLLLDSSERPPSFFGTLSNRVVDMISSTRRRLYIVAPFMSEYGADICLKGLESQRRPDLRVCLLTQLSDDRLIRQNYMGVVTFRHGVLETGASIEIRGPTPAQARSVRVRSPVHDKRVITDSQAGQLTCNFSYAAHENGYEGGAILEGPVVEEMALQFEWLFPRHALIELDAMNARYQRLVQENGQPGEIL